MIRIVVADEQAERLRYHEDTIELVDDHGTSLGYFSRPFSASEIAEALKRSGSDIGWSTTSEVLARLPQTSKINSD